MVRMLRLERSDFFMAGSLPPPPPEGGFHPPCIRPPLGGLGVGLSGSPKEGGFSSHSSIFRRKVLNSSAPELTPQMWVPRNPWVGGGTSPSLYPACNRIPGLVCPFLGGLPPRPALRPSPQARLHGPGPPPERPRPPPGAAQGCPAPAARPAPASAPAHRPAAAAGGRAGRSAAMSSIPPLTWWIMWVMCGSCDLCGSALGLCWWWCWAS